MINRISQFFVSFYTQLVKMNDSPQSIAVAFGMGTFLGIFPFTGALAAVTLAYFFRINKAAALLGSIVTNTWLSVVSFVVSLKIGCFFLGLEWQTIYERAKNVIADFSWQAIWDVTFLKIFFALMIGYLIVGICVGLLCYVVVYFILSRKSKNA